MTDYELYGDSGHIGLNGSTDTVAVASPSDITTNETRVTKFDPDFLIEWAEAVKDAYGHEAAVVFTPGKPMMATKRGKDCTLGIAIAPRIHKGGMGDSDD